MKKSQSEKALAGKSVLITGGLGFIGSNLAARLVRCGADVTLLDAMLPGYGGNLANVAEIQDSVRINFSDIRDVNSVNYLVRGKDVVFHLAGQVDHILSLKDPYPDIDINIRGTAVVMEAVRKISPGARVVYTGTRGQYGKSVSLPVNEEAPMNPMGLYELSNLTAERIVGLYSDNHDIAACRLRLTNVYGPRAQMEHPRYGVVNWFIRLVLDDQTIKVFGKGDLKRDFLYVEDAVDAILLAATHPAAVGEVFNVGHDVPTTFGELAKLLVEISGRGRWEFAPFSPERAAQEPGHFYSDISKIRSLLGWEPRTKLIDGLKQTLEFYEQQRDRYWEPSVDE